MDGTLVITTGECKEGMDISYQGTWGYHPLVISLAETGEVLRLVNRSGNRPSHEGAAEEVDPVITLCRKAGFRKIVFRGDTAFSQSAKLDAWDREGVTFYFGFKAMPNLEKIADDLPPTAWRKVLRPPRWEVKTEPRRKPVNVKQRIVRRRGYEVLQLKDEDYAEFDYQPVGCKQPYRMVVLRKVISHEKGEQRLFDEVRYFFYITNDWACDAEEVVFEANNRCDQENLIAQLGGGVRAALCGGRQPVQQLGLHGDDQHRLEPQGLVGTVAAGVGPLARKHQTEKHRVLRMEFRTFVNAFIKIPCQIVRIGRKLIYRVLSYNPHLPVFFRLAKALRC